MPTISVFWVSALRTAARSPRIGERRRFYLVLAAGALFVLVYIVSALFVTVVRGKLKTSMWQSKG